MLKHLLSFSLLLSSVFVSAQTCNPDMNFANAGPGVYPVSIATPDCSDTLGIKTIVSITDTTISFTNPIPLDVTIYYDSSRIVSVSGLPTGLSFGTDVDGITNAFLPYGAWVNGGTIPNVTPAIGCVYVHGNPSSWIAAQAGGDTGVYTIEVEYDARIVQTDPDVSAFGVPNGTWLSAVDPGFGGGTITIEVPMDTDPITDLQVPTLTGSSSAFINTSETYFANTGENSYVWTVVGGTIQGGQGTPSATVVWDGGVAEGSVTVAVGDGAGCTKSQFMDVAIAGVGVYEAVGLNTRIYPNPSNGVLNIEIESSGSTLMSVLDASGRLVHTDKFNGSIYRSDISELNPGIYLLKLETEAGISLGKIILE